MSDKNNTGNPWSKINAVQYYTKNRHSVNEIYASEKFFLTKAIQMNDSILDVGCAAGGFYEVFKSIQPTITYIGVDFSSKMILKAQKLFPQASFVISDGGLLPFRKESIDIVYCSGAIHLALNWREIIRECWRVAKRNFIFDVRLVENSASIENIKKSYEKIAFYDKWDGKAVVPYIILNVRDFLSEISYLKPKPVVQQYYGYYSQVSSMAVSPFKEVCMTMCCLGKEINADNPNCWNLPLKKPNLSDNGRH